MITDLAKGSEKDKSNKPIELAVFDFDNTSIAGSSPVLLVRHLLDKKLLSPLVIARICLWGVAYKCRLPQQEKSVRALVFSAFEGMQKKEADAFLYDFFDEKINKLFREEADTAMREHAKAGRVIIVLSATFEPIVVRAMEFHPFDFQLSTRMCVDDTGAYTCQVEGNPIEGEEKVLAVKRFADERYGEGSWKLAYAYGDHHSDRPLLFAAEHAMAVCPDKPLKRTARNENWQVLNWV